MEVRNSMSRLLQVLLFALLALPLRAQVAPEPDAPPAKSTPSQPHAPANVPAQTQPTTANSVNLYFVVRNAHGGLVSSLTKSDCTILDDNTNQAAKTFEAETRQPLTLGILLDTSLSQQLVLPVEEQATATFLRHLLQPKDEAFLISFDVTVDMLADLTSSASQLKRALDGAQINSASGHYANGTIPSIGKPKGTLLYDAVYLAANDKLRREAGRKVLLLLTDGLDEGSLESLKSAMEAAQKADAIVYVLLITDPSIYGTPDFYGTGSMRKLAKATGGRVFKIGNNGRKMKTALDEIENELRTQYRASYTPFSSERNGSYRHIQVTCQQKGKPLRVQVRQGYYAIPR